MLLTVLISSSKKMNRRHKTTGMNSRNTAKMVEHKLVLFTTVIALWTLVTLLIKLIRTLLKWKYIQHQTHAILAAITVVSYFLLYFILFFSVADVRCR